MVVPALKMLWELHQPAPNQRPSDGLDFSTRALASVGIRCIWRASVGEETHKEAKATILVVLST